jgi:hypothetical protein
MRQSLRATTWTRFEAERCLSAALPIALPGVLASEGGRTSRGSIGNMREYVALLNQLHSDGRADLDAIEAFWIARVHEFFAAKPFRIRLDASCSLRTVVRDVLDQAEERQKTTPGVY